jgi:hypothetical protein
VTPSWYPGADVVDMLGYDESVSMQYQELIALGNDTKMVTLPELGNVPIGLFYICIMPTGATSSPRMMISIRRIRTTTAFKIGSTMNRVC